MQPSQKPNAWMFVDETASSDGPYQGACAVILTLDGMNSLKDCTEEFRSSFPERGIPLGIEIHAGVWVQERDLFPGVNAFGRIKALGSYLRMASKCQGVRVVNILVDTSQPEKVGTKFRERIWEELFLAFERFLQENGVHGETIFDRDRVGEVVETHERLREAALPRQASPPTPADSRDHDALQFADVCAYFMLQQFAPNTQVRAANAANYINRICDLCPHPTSVGQALIRDLI